MEPNGVNLNQNGSLDDLYARYQAEIWFRLVWTVYLWYLFGCLSTLAVVWALIALGLWM